MFKLNNLTNTKSECLTLPKVIIVSAEDLLLFVITFQNQIVRGVVNKSEFSKTQSLLYYLIP